MIRRTGLLITGCLLCHLLLIPTLVTSQLLPARPSAIGDRPSGADNQESTAPFEMPTAKGQQPTAAPQRPHIVGPEQPGEEVTIEAQQQEKAGGVYRLRGEVAITFRNFVLRADEITYDTASGDITATGDVIFDGGPHDEHLEASRATYNVRTDSGRFYDVTGTTGARFRGKHVVLTSSNPFFFSGALVEKDGPDHFVVHHGVVTSCEMPNPKWTFNADKITVDAGEEARIYHSTFRLFHVPILYLPFAQHPVDRLGRQSGFLIPNVGQSSRKGTILGEALYWAINRSMDATIGAEYFSHRGWAQHGEFRARPSQDSTVNVRYFGVLDRGFGSPHVDQGGEDVRANLEAKLPFGFRGVADIDYLSSFVFRLAFAETFSLAVNSEVRSNAFLSKASQGYFFNLIGSRYQNFQSTTRGDLITILHAPSLELASVDRRLGRSPVLWSYEVAAQGVSRREPNFVTAELVGRFDVHPAVSMPLMFGGWSVRPEVALRETWYSQRRDPSLGVPGIGLPVDRAINRRALETTVEIRPPSVSRIFERKVLDHTIKHTIEPRVAYRYVEGVDNFAEIIRFDARDIVSDTNELEYGIINRIFAKPTHATECTGEPQERGAEPAAPAKIPGTPGVQTKPTPAEAPGCQPGPPQAREILSWEVAQKYFFDPIFGGALVAGRRNVFTTTAEFTGIAFLTDPRRFSPVVSRLRMHTSKSSDIEWHIDYDTQRGRINSSTALIDRRFGDFFLAGSHAYLQAPGEIAVGSTTLPGPTQFNQLRSILGYGHPNKRGVNAAVNIGFDVQRGFLQYSAFQTSYNWDCCGLSFEYRRFALGSVRNENQFRFALSLTNIGTFGTLRSQERLF